VVESPLTFSHFCPTLTIFEPLLVYMFVKHHLLCFPCDLITIVTFKIFVQPIRALFVSVFAHKPLLNERGEVIQGIISLFLSTFKLLVEPICVLLFILTTTNCFFQIPNSYYNSSPSLISLTSLTVIPPFFILFYTF